MAELLLELLSEEIPARMQPAAAAELHRRLAKALKDAGLEFEAAEAYATPRRLALVVAGLPPAQPDLREERRGPRIDAPEKAIQGFLKGNGLTREQCEERETEKGSFLFAVIERRGQPTGQVLAKLLPEVLADLPWPKSMRWGNGVARWVRPLHSILCLFDGLVVGFEFAGVTTGAETRGHRFHAPDAFEVADFADYRSRLDAAYVAIDAVARRRKIEVDATALARNEGLTLVPDAALLDELAGLVEWPVALMGRMDERFLALPREVLVSAMRTHQRYLALNDDDGRLAPAFVTIANLEASDGGVAVTAGNERVLTARLADAEFFWRTDLETRLEDRLPALDDMVFHAKLGSLGDKVTRIAALAGELAAEIPGAEADHCRAAAMLAKADLVSEMVGEFPELQGLMGGYYAEAQGERAEVAAAIRQHYAPQGPGDKTPSEPTAIAVALADKIDTLVGFFAIGETPTGSRDPFALRRAVLGVIRIVLENGLSLELRKVFETSSRTFSDTHGDTDWRFDDGELLAFFADRLKVHLRESGVRHDLIQAVFALGGEDDLVRLMARVGALAGFLDSEDGANLLTAYRRAVNIVRIEEKKDGRSHDRTVDSELLAEPEERTLHDELEAAMSASAGHLEAEDFAAVMATLAKLRRPVDDFFDEVTVNADNAAARENRLALLSRIRATLHQVADFSQIEG
ncbi:MAG: glycine--tRNA ligase subunit beta [Alphaproteobacteria bacterium]|nr:glycine--tRNA ligase subunit beta [Alphaproteobacteria bacterium]